MSGGRSVDISKFFCGCFWLAQSCHKSVNGVYFALEKRNRIMEKIE